MPTKTYTIKTEQGAIRLMTPEEVRDMVRRKMKRAKSYGGSREHSVVRPPRSPTRLLSTSAMNDGGVELRQPESEKRDHDYESEQGRDEEGTPKIDGQVQKMSTRVKSLSLPLKSPNKSKISEQQMSELIRQSIRRARLQVASITPRQTGDGLSTEQEPKSIYDSDPLGHVKDESVVKAFSWSSLEDSEDDEVLKECEDQPVCEEVAAASKAASGPSPSLPVTVSSESQITVKTENLSDYPASKTNPKLLRGRLIPPTSQTAASKAENKSRKPDAPGSKETEAQVRTETDSSHDDIESNPQTHRLEISRNVVNAIVSSSMTRAEESARHEIKSLLQQSTRRDSDFEVETEKGTHVMKESDIKALIRESIFRARKQAQEEIDLVVQETLRLARESARDQIREMFVESMQKARETSYDNASVVMQQTLRESVAVSSPASQPSSKESPPSRNRRLSAALNLFGKNNGREPFLERSASPRKPTPELFRKVESFRNTHDSNYFAPAGTNDCVQEQNTVEDETNGPKGIGLPAEFLGMLMKNDFGRVPTSTAASESKRFSNVGVTRSEKNSTDSITNDSQSVQVDSNEEGASMDEKGVSIRPADAEDSLEIRVEPTLNAFVAVKTASTPKNNFLLERRIESESTGAITENPTAEDDQRVLLNHEGEARVGVASSTNASLSQLLCDSQGVGMTGRNGEVAADVNVVDPQTFSQNGVVGRLKWKEAILAKIAALESQRVARNSYASSGRHSITHHQLALSSEKASIGKRDTTAGVGPPLDLDAKEYLESSPHVADEDVSLSVDNTFPREVGARDLSHDGKTDQSSAQLNSVAIEIEDSTDLNQTETEKLKPYPSDENNEHVDELKPDAEIQPSDFSCLRKSAYLESKESKSRVLNPAEEAATDGVGEGKVGFELWKKSLAITEKELSHTNLFSSRSPDGNSTLLVSKIVERHIAVSNDDEIAKSESGHDVTAPTENDRRTREAAMIDHLKNWSTRKTNSGDVFDGLHYDDYQRNRLRVAIESVHSRARKGTIALNDLHTKHGSNARNPQFHPREAENGRGNAGLLKADNGRSADESKNSQQIGSNTPRTPCKRVAAVPAIEMLLSDGNVDCASELENFSNHHDEHDEMLTKPVDEPVTASSTIKARREKHRTSRNLRGRKTLRTHSDSAISTLSKSADSRSKNYQRARDRDAPTTKRITKEKIVVKSTTSRSEGKRKKDNCEGMDTGFCVNFMEMLIMSEVGDDEGTVDGTVEDTEKSEVDSLVESVCDTYSVNDSTHEKSSEDDATDSESSFEDGQSDQRATFSFSTDQSGTNASTVGNTEDEKDANLFWWS